MRDEEYPYTDNTSGWFVGIIVVLALLASGYLVFSAGDAPCFDTCSTTIEATE